MKEYRLQYLNDKEFEALSAVNPRYANTKDDLGFADMTTNRIFVRKTGNRLLDQFVTNHEIEEVLAKNSAHQDEFNIRHKKGKDVFAKILPALAAVVAAPLGPWASAGAAAGTRAATATQMESNPPKGGRLAADIGLAGLGGYLGGSGAAPGVAASKAATTAAGRSPSYIGQVLSGAQSTLGFQSGAQKALASNAIAPAIKAPTMSQGFNASEMANPLSSTVGSNFAPSVGRISASNPFATGGAMGAMGFNAPVSAAPTAGANLSQPSAAPSSAQPATSQLQFQPPSEVGANFGNAVNQLPASNPLTVTPTAGGAAGSLGGGLLRETTKVTTKTPMLTKLLGDNWRQTLLGAAIPLVGNMFAQPMFPPGSENTPFSPAQSKLFQETAQMVRQGANVQLSPAQQQVITSNFDDALKQARQNIMDRYKALRPGSDIENDSQFRQAMIEMESDFAEKKANALAGAQLGLGAQQTQMMAELANMEIGDLSMRAGISYGEARDFKDMLAQAGFLVATGGQPAIYSSK